MEEKTHLNFGEAKMEEFVVPRQVTSEDFYEIAEKSVPFFKHVKFISNSF